MAKDEKRRKSTRKSDTKNVNIFARKTSFGIIENIEFTYGIRLI